MTPHIPLTPPTDAEIAVLEQALQRSGQPYTEDDLLTVMAWLAQTELAHAWLVEVRAGRGALLVEQDCVRFVWPVDRESAQQRQQEAEDAP